jgi:hypothetical protein
MADSNHTHYADAIASGESWDNFCDELKQAGRLVLENAPDSELDRAEGLRYLTRLLRMGLKFGLEYADPAAPQLIEYMNETQKFGVDNPDQLYQWARINGQHSYRLRGKRGTVGYIGIGVYAGSAGRGGRRTISHINAADLDLGSDEAIDIILSPEEQSGHWIKLDEDTTTLMVRQTMNDRNTEIPANLTLECINQNIPAPLSSEQLVKGLQRAVKQVTGSTKMFAYLSNQWKQTPNILHPRDDAMAKQSFGDPDLYYSGGYWEVQADEALIIEFTPPQCHYWSFLLCNYWTESLEFRYRPIWTNKHKANYRDDGSVKIIIAHQDPKISGTQWLDTEGHCEGAMTLRYLLYKDSPIPTPKLVKLAEI